MWEGQRCNDWGVRVGACSAEVRVTDHKWADHKLLEWTEGGRPGNCPPGRSFTRTEDLTKPPALSDKEWQDMVEKAWQEQ
eukprot:16331942-Heterocapsa_arctica.AAC.1